MPTFYGYLHSWTSGYPEAGTSPQPKHPPALEMIIPDLPEVGAYKGTLQPSRRNWRCYRYLSPSPLMGEELGLYGGPFTYPFYLYQNPVTQSVLLGAFRFSITSNLVSTLNRGLPQTLVRNSINVARIAEHMRHSAVNREEKDFFVTNLQLNLNDYGSKLETMALNGTDVMGSGFLDAFKSDDFTSKQIGLMYVKDSSESARLNSRGGIQFYSDRLAELELCLGLVSRLGAFIRNI